MGWECLFLFCFWGLAMTSWLFMFKVLLPKVAFEITAHALSDSFLATYSPPIKICQPPTIVFHWHEKHYGFVIENSWLFSNKPHSTSSLIGSFFLRDFRHFCSVKKNKNQVAEFCSMCRVFPVIDVVLGHFDAALLFAECSPGATFTGPQSFVSVCGNAL